jgi:hypothetical protein
MNSMSESWNEPDSELLDKLTRNGKLAADRVVIGIGSNSTQSERTRIAVRAALRMLIANGIITVSPIEQWPNLVLLDPPPAQATQ